MSIKNSYGSTLTNARTIEIYPEGPYKKSQMVVIVFTPDDGYFPVDIIKEFMKSVYGIEVKEE